ncbi:MAG: hypothetical protein LC623_09900 [Halobacteriales archaeon]|nr:hypothetical protein [Halobacteriales archaeon]
MATTKRSTRCTGQRTMTRKTAKRSVKRMAAKAKRPTRKVSRKTGGNQKGRRTTRRTLSRGTRPSRDQGRTLEFTELPVSGSSGSSYEPDSYTPRAELQRPKAHRGFLGFFGLR